MASTSVADVPKPGFIPAKQRAWRIVRKGEPPKALVLDNDAPIPTLKPGEILVRVQAVSFHNVSVLPLVSSHRKWSVDSLCSVYLLMVLLPNSFLKRNAELEFSGEVVDTDGSAGFVPGDKVSGFVAPDIHVTKRRGALAQYIAAKPGELIKRPDFLTLNEASGVIGVSLTAYQALFEVAKLRQEPGQSVFINGGSTSVGMYAIQIAKSYGLKVAASTSPRNAKLVEELGAEVHASYLCVVVQLLIVNLLSGHRLHRRPAPRNPSRTLQVRQVRRFYRSSWYGKYSAVHPLRIVSQTWRYLRWMRTQTQWFLLHSGIPLGLCTPPAMARRY